MVLLKRPMVGLKIPWAKLRMMVETSVAVFWSGPLLNAAAEAVTLFGTALECSVEQLSCFLCCYWCPLKLLDATMQLLLCGIE
ncbi:hypothetical protein Nepgr_022934 [Nepenthes gracilis]|uniref:Uncharacterized protein n=1 Tax=Nepenthes gracilis TaxID=150966 RepID=A0AAD3T2Z2_NEPGR|nr:hypothetical protein Nepgr_022934 [Nepenthes gracilis]